MTTFAAAMASRESRFVAIVRGVLLTAAGLYVILFWWSIYRRVWQVLRLDIRATSVVLAPRARVGYDAITSGEVPNRIRLELVQGTRTMVLVEQVAAVSRVRSIDPRVFRYTPSVTITSTVLGRFEPGPATLRATGFGGQKLLRTPAPRVRELRVQLPR
jgi:hypothetical protein